MGGTCSAYGGKERRIQGSGGGEPEGKRQLGRSRRRWEDNIKMDQMLYCPTNALKYTKPLNC